MPIGKSISFLHRFSLTLAAATPALRALARAMANMSRLMLNTAVTFWTSPRGTICDGLGRRSMQCGLIG